MASVPKAVWHFGGNNDLTRYQCQPTFVYILLNKLKQKICSIIETFFSINIANPTINEFFCAQSHIKMVDSPPGEEPGLGEKGYKDHRLFPLHGYKVSG